MAYIGNSPSFAESPTEYQDLTGGSGTVFTLDYTVGRATDLEVFVNNVRQEPDIAYTCAGTTLTMTGTIATTDDFYVVFQGKASGGNPRIGSGFFQGDNGNTGNLISGKKDIFRVHESTLDTNTVIADGDNASATGPLTLNATLTVSGNLTIV